MEGLSLSKFYQSAGMCWNYQLSEIIPVPWQNSERDNPCILVEFYYPNYHEVYLYPPNYPPNYHEVYLYPPIYLPSKSTLQIIMKSTLQSTIKSTK
jgi:hypothetical protein